MIVLTNQQARQFLLYKHGLLGKHRFSGKAGVMAFIRQVGCIQFDPIDICGKNSELVLQSRIKDFTKEMLDELLYSDRALVDYPDKNLSIFPTEDWPYFERYRQASRENIMLYPKILAAVGQVRAFITRQGPVCSADLPLEEKTQWHSAIHWSSGNNLSRSVLEQMYSTGELVIHHKVGSRKYYDLAERHIPIKLLQAPDPLPDDFAHRKWRILRRINAVGLLWNKPSGAWLNIPGLTAAERNQIIRQLEAEGKIVPVSVAQLKDTFYCTLEDLPLIEMIRAKPKFSPRCELLAPLDNLLWDRNLIRAIFGFDYTWEIYTPAAKRKYGHYVLPLLYGENLVGRMALVKNSVSRTLTIKNVWLEQGVKYTKKLEAAVNARLNKFARFNRCDTLEPFDGSI